MKYHILLIFLSCLVSCKSSKRITENENISSITGQSATAVADYSLDGKYIKEHNSNSRGLLLYPIDPQQESYFKTDEDGGVITKNAAVSFLEENKNELTDNYINEKKEQSNTVEKTSDTNINRNSREKIGSQIKEFKGLIIAVIVLVITLIGYFVIKKIL